MITDTLCNYECWRLKNVVTNLSFAITVLKPANFSLPLCQKDLGEPQETRVIWKPTSFYRISQKGVCSLHQWIWKSFQFRAREHSFLVRSPVFFLELGQGQIAALDDCLMAFVPLCWGLACSPVWRFVHSAKKLLDNVWWPSLYPVSQKGYGFKKERPLRGTYLRGQAGRKPGNKGGKIEERQEVAGERGRKKLHCSFKSGNILGCNIRLGLLKSAEWVNSLKVIFFFPFSLCGGKPELAVILDLI